MKAVKNIFVKFMCGLIVTVVALLMGMNDPDAGGLGMNGFLAFLLWVGFMFLLIKVNAYLSLGVSIVLYMILRVRRSGTVESIQGFLVLFAMAAVIFIALFALKKKWDHDIIVNNEVRKNHAMGVECCPKCGGTRVHFVQGRTETHTVHGEELHGGTPGFIGSFLDPGELYHEGDIYTEFHEGYWQCDNPRCKATWR